MFRQRLRARTSPIAYVGRALLVIVSLALIWYGLMLLMLALKVSPDAVDAISGYRSAYDYLADLTAADVGGQTRLIAGLAGLAALLIFGYLAYKEIPRPYLARTDLRLIEDDRGVIDVEPRAIERAIEAAAYEHPVVSSASGRYGPDDVTVEISVRRARELPETLRTVQAGVRSSLEQHGLPQLPVNVTVTGFDRQQLRELS